MNNWGGRLSLILAALVLPQLVGLAVTSWPLDRTSLVLIVSSGLTSAVLLAVLAATSRRRARFRVESNAGTPEQQLELRLQALEQQERRLELRELRMARRLRVQEAAEGEYVDLLEAAPDDDELEALIETDRQLIALIESEAQRAFNRVLENRYASEEGVNTELIYRDVREFITRVAALYQPDKPDALLETNLELVAKSMSSAVLHLLVVVDGLPIDLKSYSAASMYRLVRKAASYYGTYQAWQPYIESGLSVLNVARIALGINPVTIGATWAAGKLAGQGAKLLTETLVQQQALQLLHDFVRVIGFEAAMVYGGRFRYRDANWVYGAELVNLEIGRGKDVRGRDAALRELTALALRHEFDRFRLLRHLGLGERVEMSRTWAQVVLTEEERLAVAKRLAAHCRASGVDLEGKSFARWRKATEERLQVTLPLPSPGQPHEAGDGPLKSLARGLRGLGDRAGDIAGEVTTRLPLHRRIRQQLKGRGRAKRGKANAEDQAREDPHSTDR